MMGHYGYADEQSLRRSSRLVGKTWHKSLDEVEPLLIQ